MFDFENIYDAPTLKDALRYKKENPEAVMVAGGTDVVIKARDCKLRGATLLSINALGRIYHVDNERDFDKDINLAGIWLDDEENLCIGAITPFGEIVRSPIMAKTVPALAAAAETVGSPQIRNVGTVGGNICNGNTSSDTGSTLLAYDSKVELARLGDDGEIEFRQLTNEEFYDRPGKTHIAPDEIATRFIISADSYKRTFGTYIKYSMRDAMDIATLGCSVNVRLSEDAKKLERIRIAFGVAGPTPSRAHVTEEKFNGVELEGTIEEAAEKIAEQVGESILDDINPRDSWRASKAFRTHVSQESSKRATKRSIIMAGGDQ